MGDLGSTFGSTSTWGGNTIPYYIYKCNSSDGYYKVEKKEDKGFIKESEFKV
jgi:hypothetical protein